MIKILLTDFKDIPANVLFWATWVTTGISSFFIVFTFLDSPAIGARLFEYLPTLFSIDPEMELSYSTLASTFSEAPIVWIVIFSYLATMIFSFVITLVLNMKVFGSKKTNSIFMSHILAFFLNTVFGALFLFGFYQLFYFVTGEYIEYVKFTGKITALFENLTANIPTLIELPRFLAFIVTLLAADLIVWFFHWLVHRSRFFWLVSHRAHHTPEVLTGPGAGEVFAFAFIFLRFPMFLVSLALSKLIHPEVILAEVSIFYIALSFVELFNHNSALYPFLRENKIIYFVTRFFGCGTIHYTHHSAKPGEQEVNLSNYLFNFWDRLFGTYLEPPMKKPEIGLTNQPEILLNPFVLYFSGFAVIFYELKHNSLKQWIPILFGSVQFKPANTWDPLIIKKWVPTQDLQSK